MRTSAGPPCKAQTQLAGSYWLDSSLVVKAKHAHAWSDQQRAMTCATELKKSGRCGAHVATTLAQHMAVENAVAARAAHSHGSRAS